MSGDTFSASDTSGIAFNNKKQPEEQNDAVTVNERQEDGDDDLNQFTPIIIPINAVVHIFSFLTPDELLVAQKVCRIWYKVIKSHRRAMQRRKFFVLTLSTNVEFSIHAYEFTKLYKYSAQKYFNYFQDAREKSRCVQTPADYIYSFPCLTTFHPNVPRYLTAPEAFHHAYGCSRLRSQESDYTVPELHTKIFDIPKGFKLYTPPQRYFEVLNEMTIHSVVKTFVLNHYALTMTTGYMIQKYCRPFVLKNLVLHNVNCKAINGEEFQKLLTEVLPSQHYSFENIKKLIPSHFNAKWLNHPVTLQATSIRFTPCLNRLEEFPTCFIKFGFTEQDLIAFLVHPNASKNREVFQIHVVNLDFAPGFERRLRRCAKPHCSTGFRRIVVNSDVDAAEQRRLQSLEREDFFENQQALIARYRAEFPDRGDWVPPRTWNQPPFVPTHMFESPPRG